LLLIWDTPCYAANACILSWRFHALTSHPGSLFDANIFYPVRHSLAFSEHMLRVLPISMRRRCWIILLVSIMLSLGPYLIIIERDTQILLRIWRSGTSLLDFAPCGCRRVSSAWAAWLRVCRPPSAPTLVDCSTGVARAPTPLRGCLKTCQTNQATHHDMDHGDTNHGFARLG